MPTALTIAGSDSSGGAGMQADLRTFDALGVRGLSAVTAVTAQNDRGVSAILALPADLVTAQIEAVASDGGVAATKIGMLANAAIAESVAAAIEELDLPLVVLDPVLASSSGTRLLDNDGVQAMIAELVPRVLALTPNIPEAEALTGRRIRTPDDIRDAARRLHDMGAEHVLIKGGHVRDAAGSPATGKDADEVIDLLFDGRTFLELRVPRSRGGSMRGTGCVHASALAAFLALGHDLRTAATRAQQHVASLIGRTYTG
jgi:hydroxymethylpyrimidine/phosphomethylpyrimidine kinase